MDKLDDSQEAIEQSENPNYRIDNSFNQADFEEGVFIAAEQEQNQIPNVIPDFHHFLSLKVFSNKMNKSKLLEDKTAKLLKMITHIMHEENVEISPDLRDATEKFVQQIVGQ